MLFLLLSILVFSLKKKSYRECVVLLFAGLLFCPLFCTVLRNAFEWETDIKLEGIFESYERPEAGVREFTTGEYQEQYELWWNNSFSPRNKTFSIPSALKTALKGPLISKKLIKIPERMIHDRKCGKV